MLGKDSILFGKRWPAANLDDEISAVEMGALACEYAELKAKAPRRHAHGKRYFVGHAGVVGSSSDSNRFEEHFAIALCNLRRRWPRTDGGWFEFLDYQVPLKAHRSDRIGKVDSFGITDRGRAVVHELKVAGKSGGRGDSPAVALMEGLRYAACVEANLEDIWQESHTKFGVEMVSDSPIVQILAPRRWWCEWWKVSKAGDWSAEMANLTERITGEIGVPVEFMATEDVTRDDIEYDRIGNKFRPRLLKIPDLFQVNPANCSFAKIG